MIKNQRLNHLKQTKFINNEIQYRVDIKYPEKLLIIISENTIKLQIKQKAKYQNNY